MSKVPQLELHEPIENEPHKEPGTCSTDPTWAGFETQQYKTTFPASCPGWSLQQMEAKSCT